MKIYIGFSYPIKDNILSKGIAWWMNADYSHTYLRFEYTDSKDAIFHAAHGMVHFKSVNNFLRDNNSIKEYEIEVSRELHDQLFDKCMDLAGEKYDTLDLAKILISDIAYSTVKKEIRWKDGRGYICSELVGTICIETLKIKFNKPTFLLQPVDIDIALISNGYSLK